MVEKKSLPVAGAQQGAAGGGPSGPGGAARVVENESQGDQSQGDQSQDGHTLASHTLGSHKLGTRSGRRSGRRSRAEWAGIRAAYEDGVGVDVLAHWLGVMPETIMRHAEDEDWASPQEIVERLSAGLSASLAAADIALSQADGLDAERSVKLVDALIRAVERLRGLRQACTGEVRDGMAAPAARDGGGNDAQEVMDEQAQLARARAALERRLARLAKREAPKDVS